ncbi:hypothetical protein TNCV_3540381 [Trichonephila clavipes]|nr:hypothetical protein TNCV_3540381 [Trichonephila clavipes]
MLLKGNIFKGNDYTSQQDSLPSAYKWKESCQGMRQLRLPDVRLSLTVALNTIQVPVRYFSARFHRGGGRTLWGARGLPPLFPFHQPPKRTCGSTAI